MKSLKKTNIIKKIMFIIIIILMLCNFIIPNYSYAVDEGEGGSLIVHLLQFLCFIPDMVIEFLQNMFTSGKNLYNDDYYRYSILYSPGIIFSGDVPAFDINFINPSKNVKKETNKKLDYAGNTDPNECIEYSLPLIMDKLGYNKETNEVSPSIKTPLEEIKNILYDKNNWKEGTDEVRWTKIHKDIKIDEDLYTLCGNYEVGTSGLTWYFVKQPINTIADIVQFKEGWKSEAYCEYDAASHNQEHVYAGIKTYVEDKYSGVSDEYNKAKETIKEELQKAVKEVDQELDKSNFNHHKQITIKKDEQKLIIYVTFNTANNKYVIYEYELKEYKSTAAVLQPIVATWYKAFRRIALVGLLSVLLYIGIRIILTSTSAKEKAKYKKMLKDWLMALCLLFILHYIMNITVVVVDKINDVVKASSISPTGEDILMTSVRNKILNGDSWSVVLTEVAIYVVLMVYTIIFTIQYIRRTIHIAFLTMIAPLITLTYPLDKIKDGKSQAFDMWLKDYIFFTLIQVVHLLLYYIFLGTSLDMAEQGNWLFALVAIGFLTTAEKFVKKMFGFEQSKSLGTMAAGATGALVMNAMNNFSEAIGSKASSKGNGGSKGAGGANAIRTASVNPLSALTLNNMEGIQNNNSPMYDQEIGNSNVRGARDQNNSNSSNVPYANNNVSSNNINGINKKSRISNIFNSTKNFAKKYAMPPIKGAASLVGKYTMPAVKGGAKLAFAGTGAIIGFASGLAEGDLGKAATRIITGGSAGGSIGKGIMNLPSNITAGVKNAYNDVVNTVNEGIYGKEAAQNIKFDKEFRKSPYYSKLRQEHTNFSDEDLQEILDAGITDFERIDKIFRNNKKSKVKFSIHNAIAYSEIAKQCPKPVLYDMNRFIRFCENNKITGFSPEELEELRNRILEFK